ncbi:hypothetical protein C1H46_012348 [Malus baccata]|uniref:Uncharacterized protein n=1 Tax=Malus baccata TaxID=106549 RepID=A0A540MTB7_MALBA|nr:hypothetical protein C1H46_012348 [Malus baccata]
MGRVRVELEAIGGEMGQAGVRLEDLGLIEWRGGGNGIWGLGFGREDEEGRERRRVKEFDDAGKQTT